MPELVTVSEVTQRQFDELTRCAGQIYFGCWNRSYVLGSNQICCRRQVSAVAEVDLLNWCFAFLGSLCSILCCGVLVGSTANSEVIRIGLQCDNIDLGGNVRDSDPRADEGLQAGAERLAGLIRVVAMTDREKWEFLEDLLIINGKVRERGVDRPSGTAGIVRRFEVLASTVVVCAFDAKPLMIHLGIDDDEANTLRADLDTLEVVLSQNEGGRESGRSFLSAGSFDRGLEVVRRRDGPKSPSLEHYLWVSVERVRTILAGMPAAAVLRSECDGGKPFLVLAIGNVVDDEVDGQSIRVSELLGVTRHFGASGSPEDAAVVHSSTSSADYWCPGEEQREFCYSSLDDGAFGLTVFRGDKYSVAPGELYSYNDGPLSAFAVAFSDKCDIGGLK